MYTPILDADGVPESLQVLPCAMPLGLCTWPWCHLHNQRMRFGTAWVVRSL